MFLYCYRCNAIFCGVNLVYLYLFNTCFPLILRDKIVNVILYAYYSKTQVVFIFFCEILLKICYCSHTTVPRGVLAYSCQKSRDIYFFQWVKKLYNSRYSFSVFLESPYRIIYCNNESPVLPFPGVHLAGM